MKICYLVADHGVPVLGRKGCSTHVRETCRGLMESGHEVFVYTPNRGDDLSMNPGLDLRIVPPPRAKWLGSDLRMYLYNFRLLKALRETFRRERPEVMYERYSLYSFAGLRIAREFRMPRILEVNAHLVEEQRRRLHFPWLAQRFENYLLKTAQTLIVVSQPLKESFMRLGLPDERIIVMPMAVDINRFRPEVEPRDLRGQFGLAKKTITGYVGTLTDWHGIDMLYDVAENFVRRSVECGFLVIGGDERQVLDHRERVARRGLGDFLCFAGSVPYRDVPSYISGMDVTVITNSTQWASPTKLFEYQAMGKPAVAPDLIPIREVMAHGNEGLLFEPGNITELTESVRRLHDSPEERMQMGARARERVMRAHSWDVNVTRIVGAYEKLLASGR